ncbi:MAG: hypothetical protein ACUZ8N_11615 [Candidatus Scalindua sp.]
MPLDIIMVITVVLGTMANITVLAIQGIMIINMSSIRENIIITIASNLDTITSGVTDLVTIKIMEIINVIIIRAIRASLCI